MNDPDLLPHDEESSRRAHDLRRHRFQIIFPHEAKRDAVPEFRVQAGQPGLDYRGIFLFGEHPDQLEGEPQTLFGIAVKLTSVHPPIDGSNVSDPAEVDNEKSTSMFALYSPIIHDMGGERASTVRQIRSGKICALCRSALPQPHTQGEQLCAKCRGERKRHRVYMFFQNRKGWHCQFLEEDLKTPLPRRFTFQSESKVRQMAERGGAAMNLDTLHALDHAIEIGRGGVWLELTEEQYRELENR